MLPPLLTIEEAAAKLCTTKRRLRSWLYEHPTDAAGEPFFKLFGRTKLFDEEDLARILKASTEKKHPRPWKSLPARDVPRGDYATLVALRKRLQCLLAGPAKGNSRLSWRRWTPRRTSFL
jgi:hypothetical protein